MRSRMIVIFMAAVLTAVLVAACGGGDEESTEAPASAESETGTETGTETAGTTIQVTAKEFSFDPADATAPADTDVTVEVVNVGSIEHDWTIESESVAIPVTAGQTATGTVNLPAGTYKVICSIPGHEEAGMKGTLTVA